MLHVAKLTLYCFCSYRYTWVGSCNETGEVLFEIVDPYLDSNGRSAMWLPSTPHYCLDHIECQVASTLSGDTDSASLLIDDVSGKKSTCQMAKI